ncbi:Nucleotide-binding universal stress protein, UspA family [Desulfacinum hydrothermale DSM 13146]|uniref:Nucleotide-binding universal stress protein, UspA family n=1 Tax=Desulfacinum hydrothermale DSM 13146 TaxID=1121390 RepID=A0A1W1WYP0_9BACT|nr:universal stress protein [Desulfacinum hydrothermale]SMC16754.1 Nucleotide-binding universal stress protein, UspA family [Desulfacinum hydrothermale DSM 13146]
MEKKRILAAVDGSPWSHLVVQYVIRMVDPGMLEIVLFHVSSPIPESFWDLEKSPAFRGRLAPVAAWEAAQKQAVEDFMEAATASLRQAGVPDESVRVVVRRREVGISRDLALEAHQGYDAVVVGRRGVSDVKDLILGSVATKLLGRVVEVPLWIVGEAGSPDGVVVALDASDAALQAVNFTASLVGPKPRRVLLVHVLRGMGPESREILKSFSPEAQRDWRKQTEAEMERAVARMDAVFERASTILEAEGLPRHLIETKVITGATSRAVAIVQAARLGGYETVVVGRRGLSRVEEFFMGRVSNKVVQLARDRTVWVVS